MFPLHLFEAFQMLRVVAETVCSQQQHCHPEIKNKHYGIKFTHDSLTYLHKSNMYF